MKIAELKEAFAKYQAEYKQNRRTLWEDKEPLAIALEKFFTTIDSKESKLNAGELNDDARLELAKMLIKQPRNTELAKLFDKLIKLFGETILYYFKAFSAHPKEQAEVLSRLERYRENLPLRSSQPTYNTALAVLNCARQVSWSLEEMKNVLAQPKVVNQVIDVLEKANIKSAMTDDKYFRAMVAREPDFVLSIMERFKKVSYLETGWYYGWYNMLKAMNRERWLVRQYDPFQALATVSALFAFCQQWRITLDQPSMESLFRQSQYTMYALSFYQQMSGDDAKKMHEHFQLFVENVKIFSLLADHFFRNDAFNNLSRYPLPRIVELYKKITFHDSDGAIRLLRFQEEHKAVFEDKAVLELMNHIMINDHRWRDGNVGFFYLSAYGLGHILIDENKKFLLELFQKLSPIDNPHKAKFIKFFVGCDPAELPRHFMQVELNLDVYLKIFSLMKDIDSKWYQDFSKAILYAPKAIVESLPCFIQSGLARDAGYCESFFEITHPDFHQEIQSLYAHGKLSAYSYGLWRQLCEKFTKSRQSGMDTGDVLIRLYENKPPSAPDLQAKPGQEDAPAVAEPAPPQQPAAVPDGDAAPPPRVLNAEEQRHDPDDAIEGEPPKPPGGL